MAMAMAIRICAVTAALLVLASFGMFAVDELYEGSENQVYSIKGNSIRAKSQGMIDHPSPAAPVERLREKSRSAPRELIDDANDVLLAPFANLVESRDPWPSRVVSGLLAVLIFGLGGLLLANVFPHPRHKVTDWREATS